MLISTLYLFAFELENCVTMTPKRCSLVSLMLTCLNSQTSQQKHTIRELRTLPGILTVSRNFEFSKAIFMSVDSYYERKRHYTLLMLDFLCYFNFYLACEAVKNREKFTLV